MKIPSGAFGVGGEPLGIARGLTTALSTYVCTFRLSINSISAVIRFWDKRVPVVLILRRLFRDEGHWLGRHPAWEKLLEALPKPPALNAEGGAESRLLEGASPGPNLTSEHTKP